MKHVSLDNDWRYKYRVTTDNATTGATIAAAGLAGLQAWFSLTRGGATINAALTKSMAELSGTPGTYTAVVDGDVLRTYLAALDGQVIWEVFGDGLNVYTSVNRRVKGVREL
ncbi:MAG TPA: hypothetical protein VF910_00960 [Candidatus Bathyarchaeia archaeon]